MKKTIIFIAPLLLAFVTHAQTNSNQTADSFPNATSKVYVGTRLSAVCIDGKYYRIHANGKVDQKPTIIQNKNEYCEYNKCIRIKINSAGYIVRFLLPNTTDEIICGKVDGNKMYFCKKPDGSDIKKMNYVTFSGNKLQAAIAVVVFDWFR